MKVSQNLKHVMKPIGQARGLPNEHYTTWGSFNLEKEKLLFSQWTGVGVASEVPEIGDAKPIYFLKMPLLIIRDKNSQVRVFQNTCRHRGMILVEKDCKIEGAIRCPYHSWCYSTEGELITTPHIGGPGQNKAPNILKSEFSLIEIRSHIWRDVIWININANAPPFEKSMTNIIERWCIFDQLMFHGGSDSRFQLKIASNWKLAVENYCESYHLPWVHPGLNSYSRLEDHYNIESHEEFSGQGSIVYKQLIGKNGERFPDFKNLSKKWKTASEYLAIYPNVLLGVHRDHAFTIILTPEAPDITVENIHIYYSRKNTDASLRKLNTRLWKSVFEEDIFVVEGMQRGRHGQYFDGGPFSPTMEGPTHCFHKWVAKRLSIELDK